jgi:glycine betaine/proline transport system permease protein
MTAGRRGRGALFWLALAAITLALSFGSKGLVAATGWRWLVRYPKSWELGFEKGISAALKWLLEDASLGGVRFRDLTRMVSTLIEGPYGVIRNLMVDGFGRGQGQQAVEILPPVSWAVVLLGFGLLAFRVGGMRLAALVLGCFLYLLVFGLWDSAMVTLASVAIAVPLGVLGGVALGIAAFRSPAFERALRPVLDLMQTVPVFAYLVPILILFGFGPTAALVATIIYAMPPMVRTAVALREVPPELSEAGRMSGCTRRQLLWKVQLPAARETMLVGVNQVIMLTLNMVIIASMIGAGGLGYDVLTALRKLAIGAGVEAGLGIVALAIALDRLSQALARRAPGLHEAGAERGWLSRHRWPVAFAVLLVLSWPLAALVPALRHFPQALHLSMGSFWETLISWINLHLYDQIEAAKVFVLTWFMAPVRVFLHDIPWPWGIALAGLAAWRMLGWQWGLIALAMAGFIAGNGLWPEAMTTLYLCGVSVCIAMLAGVPIGIAAGQSERLNRVVTVVIDTLQTLPTFVYLIPVVMLFRVGDFSAMVAVVLYAMAPAIRYAAHGIRSTDPQLIEAGLVSGCTRRQLLWKVRLPQAMPAILLGLNQTIMLALSMLVITALVGTRDLGQQVYIALSKANAGLGIVAGLSVAFIAILADRMVGAASKARAQTGGEGHG